MQKLKLSFLIAIICFGKITTAQSSVIIHAYIEKYRDIAIAEMKRSGVPASITLAQGIHETSAGQSVLVLKSNNHFGIKCKSEWKGPSVSHDDDARGECFRKYDDPYNSYKDHSDFLTSRPHYASLFKLDPTDYEGWAYGLKKAGYATNPKYPQVLIKLIRDYNLQDYTLIALGRKEGYNKNDAMLTKAETSASVETSNAIVIKEVKPDYPSGVFKINETSVVFVEKGTSFLAIAEKHSIALSRLFEFNDMRAHDVAEKDGLIYLQRKRRTGANEFHTVEYGESIFDIAQKEGIRTENLLTYNLLKPNMQPAIGEVLYLHKQAEAMPKLASAIAVKSMESAMNVSVAAVQVSANLTPGDFLLHTVQPKETLYAISKKYSVSLKDLKGWNDLNGEDLKTGQQIRIKKMYVSNQSTR